LPFSISLSLSVSSSPSTPTSTSTSTVERGEHLDVRAMFDGLCARIEEIELKADRVH